MEQKYIAELELRTKVQNQIDAIADKADRAIQSDRKWSLSSAMKSISMEKAIEGNNEIKGVDIQLEKLLKN